MLKYKIPQIVTLTHYRYNAGKKKEEIEGVREIIDDMAEHLVKGETFCQDG